MTGTRTPESSQRATVRTAVVTREEAERRGATNVGEALSGELGVQVNPSAYGFLGNPSAIQIQGFDRERVLVLEDGERVIGDVGGAIDLAAVPLADVEQIEVVSGPTSSLYGTSAIGGVVNVRTGPPRAPGPSARLRLEGRSRRGLVTQGTGAFRDDDDWAAVDLGYQRSDGISLRSDVPDLAVPAIQRRLIGFRVGSRPATPVGLMFKARWLHDDLDGLSTETFPGLGSFTIDLPETTDRYSLALIETLEFGRGSSLRLAASEQWFENSTLRDRRDSPVDERRERSHQMQGFEATATLADGNRAWVFGGRVETERFEQSLARTSPNSEGLAESRVTEVPETGLGSAAVYGQLGWRLSDQLTVMPGVRFEAHRRFGSVVAPRLAAAYRPSDALALRLAGGRGFRAPSAKEFGFFFDHSALGYRVVGNDSLVPETSWGVNGDVTVRPDQSLLLRAGGFANWVRNLIDYALAPDQPETGVTDYSYVNVNRARTFGAEASTVFRLSNRFRSEVGYAYLWARDDSNRRPLPSRPPHTLQASLVTALPSKTELVARWRAVSEAFVDIGFEAPPFMTLDLRLSKDFGHGIDLYGGVLNAFGTQRDPLRIGDQRPMAGRIFYVGAVVTLPGEEEMP